MGTTHHDNLTTGNLAATGTLAVTGAATFASTITQSGATTFTEAVTVGVDGTGHDVTLYGDTASCYFQWDADTCSILIPGTSGNLKIGALASTAGSGTVLSATTPRGLEVYADDGGAAIGSGTMTRAGEFRNLQTYTSGNREQEAVGVMGKLVSIAGTNRHNMCGVMGSYEVGTSLTVGGQAAATDTWCQAAIIGRVGGTSITIDTNGVLAGVAAMSNVATALAANNGIYPAFYAGKWSGTETWSHGLYIQHNAVDKAIQVGELASDDQTGIHLSSTNPNVIDSFADDNDTALTNAVYTNIRGRTMLFRTPTEGSLYSVMGQIKCADEVDFNPGVFAGVRGYIETMDDTDVKSGAKVWAVDACIDAALAAATVKSGGIMAGVHAELTGAGQFVQDSTGILAGVYIDETVTTGTWGYGVYIKNATNGIYIDPVNAAGTSALMVGAAATSSGSGAIISSGGKVGFFFDDGGVAIDGYRESMNVGLVLTANVSGGASTSMSALHVYIDQRADYTTSTTTGMSALWASYLIRDSSTYDGGDDRDVSGAHCNFDVASGSTLASGSVGACLSLGGNLAGTVSGLAVGINCRQEPQATGFNGFVRFEEAGPGTGMISDTKGSDSTTKYIRMYIEDALYYIAVTSDA